MRLEIATRGGAAVLGRTDIGSLEVGKCADFFALDLNQIEFAGGLHDPVASVVFCSPMQSQLHRRRRQAGRKRRPGHHD